MRYVFTLLVLTLGCSRSSPPPAPAAPTPPAASAPAPAAPAEATAPEPKDAEPKDAEPKDAEPPAPKEADPFATPVKPTVKLVDGSIDLSPTIAMSQDGTTLYQLDTVGDEREGDTKTLLRIVDLATLSDSETFELEIRPGLETTWDEAQTAAEQARRKAMVETVNARLAGTSWLPVDLNETHQAILEPPNLILKHGDKELARKATTWNTVTTEPCPPIVEGEEEPQGCGCEHNVSVSGWFQPHLKKAIVTATWDTTHRCEAPAEERLVITY